MKNIILIFIVLISFQSQSFSQKISTYFYENNTRSFWWEKYALVLETDGNNVKGYLGMALQGSFNGYFEGKMNGKIITAKYKPLGGIDNEPTTKLLIDISKKNPRIHFGNNKASMISSELHPKEIQSIVEINDNLKMYKSPDRRADLVGEINQINDISILEIGKLEKHLKDDGSEEVNLWYKVKIGQHIGWIYGLMDISYTKSYL